jgi:hypothetical protein
MQKDHSSIPIPDNEFKPFPKPLPMVTIPNLEDID